LATDYTDGTNVASPTGMQSREICVN